MGYALSAAKVLFLAATLVHICAIAQVPNSATRVQVPEEPPASAPMTALHGNNISVRAFEIETPYGHIHKIAWSPDSRLFAIIQTTKTNAQVVVYDALLRQPIAHLTPKIGGSYSGDNEVILGGDVAFSPDGLILAGGIGIITLWNTSTWNIQSDIRGPFERGSNAASNVKSIAFSPNSKSLAVFYDSVVWPETLRVDDLAAAVKLSHTRVVDHSIFNSAAIMQFDIPSGRRIFVFRATSTPRSATLFKGNIVYSPDGSALIFSSTEIIPRSALKEGEFPTGDTESLILLDSISGEVTRRIDSQYSMPIDAIAVSRNEPILATGTSTTTETSHLDRSNNKWVNKRNDDPIKLWNLESASKIMEFGPLRGAVKAIEFHPNGWLMVSCQTDTLEREAVWAWDISTGRLLTKLKTPRSGTDISSCAISPDGRAIAATVSDVIYIFQLAES